MFALQGAWPILPIAGAELLALGCAIYYVQRKLQYRQIITVSDSAVVVDKGFHAPEEHWHFPKGSTGLSVIPEQHPWDAPQLCVYDQYHRVALGEFLNREDALQLTLLLKAEIRVGACSTYISSHF